jgi:hypothetical protein
VDRALSHLVQPGSLVPLCTRARCTKASAAPQPDSRPR